MQAWLEAGRRGALGSVVEAGDRRVILERADRAGHAFLLAEGVAEVLQRSSDGFSVVVKILVGPTLFGQIEPLAREREYLETVRVAGKARYFRVEGEAFRSLVSSDATLGYECLVDMSRAFCITARFEQARLFETEALLANLLVSYAQVLGEETADGVRITLRRSQANLAEAIGGGERSVNRTLAVWKIESLITKIRGHYTLRDLEALKEKAGELLGSLVHSV